MVFDIAMCSSKLYIPITMEKLNDRAFWFNQSFMPRKSFIISYWQETHVFPFDVPNETTSFSMELHFLANPCKLSSEVLGFYWLPDDFLLPDCIFTLLPGSLARLLSMTSNLMLMSVSKLSILSLKLSLSNVKWFFLFPSSCKYFSNVRFDRGASSRQLKALFCHSLC